MTGLLIGPDERERIKRVREIAERNPVDMTKLAAKLNTPEGKRAHRVQMTEQSVLLPAAFLCCFSIETGHRGGTFAHLSVSLGRPGRVPSQLAMEMIMVEFGMRAPLDPNCNAIWPEDLEQGQAINVAQPFRPQ